MKLTFKKSQNQLMELNNQAIPQTLPTILVNNNIIGPDFLNGINTMSELEKTIFQEISNYKGNNDALQRIFHLIQIWGGNAGRHVYVHQNFNWEVICERYRHIVDVCCAQTNSGIGAQQAVYEAIMNNKIPFLGVAFITKHTRFWLHRNCGDDVLPIYDSVLSRVVMHHAPSWNTILPYWETMRNNAEQERVSLLSLERRIFNENR